MKVGNIIIYTIIFIALSVFSIGTTTKALLGMNLFELAGSVYPEKNNASMVDSVARCSDLPTIDHLDDSGDNQLVKLGKYQKICNSFVSDTMMVFTDMPKDNIVATENAKKMAQTLKEFSDYGIRPIVIAEPITDWGLIDYEEFRSGFYNDWLETYFRTLEEAGMTDKEMGTWVPFPEPNLPYWNHANATPDDFAAIVNEYLGIMKTYFPNAKGSVLLNSATYETDDFDWKSGEYVDLSPYVAGLKKEYIDSFGIQGFPWIAPAGESGKIIDAAEFINYRLAIDAAKDLGVKKIWVNTGTFSRRYTNDERKMVYVNASQRAATLDSILSEVLKIKNGGYAVSVNIFAKDKSNAEEVCDWSYLSANNEEADGIVLKDFLNKLYKDEIPVSVFDQ